MLFVLGCNGTNKMENNQKSLLNIIPEPYELEVRHGAFQLSDSTIIVTSSNKECQNIGHLLSGYIRQSTELNIKAVSYTHLRAHET